MQEVKFGKISLDLNQDPCGCKHCVFTTAPSVHVLTDPCVLTETLDNGKWHAEVPEASVLDFNPEHLDRKASTLTTTPLLSDRTHGELVSTVKDYIKKECHLKKDMKVLLLILSR